MLLNAPAWLDQIKFFASVGGAFWAAFKAYNYVKTALTETQSGVEGIKNELTKQTTAIVKATDANTGELKELRTDMGRLVQAMMVPPTPHTRGKSSQTRLN